MSVTGPLRKLIHHDATYHELRTVINKEGVKNLRAEGVELALRGKSSLEEVIRATHLDDEDDSTNALSSTNSNNDADEQIRGAA